MLARIILAVLGLGGLLLTAKAVVELYSTFKLNIARIHNYPGYRIFFHPHTIFSVIFPRLPGFNMGDQYAIRCGLDLFKPSHVDVVSIVSVFPPGRAFHVADAVAVKHILAERARYQKPTHLYRALAQYGINLAVAEGHVWRRHKKIVSGSFTETTNEYAWDESVRVADECMAEFQRVGKPVDGKLEVDVPSFVQLTLKIGLFIICSTAFSHHPPWRDDELDAIPEGHTLPFRLAMGGVIEGCMIHLMTPKWAFKLPIPRLRHIEECYREFNIYLRQMISERRALTNDLRDNETGRKDLLGALLYARADPDEVELPCEKDEGAEKAKVKMSDDELLGSMYVFLLAGHETSANTLAFTFTLLALYPEEQRKLLEHICSVVPLDAEPTYSMFNQLTRVHAVFSETLRLFPAAVVIPKYSVQDDVVPTSAKEDGTPGDKIVIPRWTEVYLNSVALHRSPKLWGQDANVFRPDRFIDAPDGSYRWPRDAYLGFSGGHRSCIGQKFATITATVTIVMLLRKYSVHLAEDLGGTAPADETFEAKMERVTDCTSYIALTLRKSHLIFKER